MNLPEVAAAFIDANYEKLTYQEMADKTGVGLTRVKRYVQALRERLGTKRPARGKKVLAGPPPEAFVSAENPEPGQPPEPQPEPAPEPKKPKAPYKLDAPFVALDNGGGDDLNDFLGIRIEEQRNGFENELRTPAGIRAAKKSRKGKVG